MIRRNVLYMVCLMAFVLGGANYVHAVSGYLAAFNTTYSTNATKLNSCTICHTAVPTTNGYGDAFAAGGHIFAAVENLDSDGDGFTNLVEIQARTFPGDPADHPVAAATLTSIAIAGAASVNSSGTSTYSATAFYNNGTSKVVIPAWSLSPTPFATISPAGILTASAVSANQFVTVNAAYTEGGIIKTANINVTIIAPPVTLGLGLLDFDGNGQDDILWHNMANGSVALWMMNAGSVVSTASIATVNPLTWAVGGVGDLNADGNPDILWMSTTGDVVAWLMSGSAFSSGVFITNLGTASPLAIAGVGDFNGDGNQDILLRDRNTGDVIVWFMTGTTISSVAVIATVDPVVWTIAGVADFNGDNNPDILWRNTATGDLVVWTMAGTAFTSGVVMGNVSPASTWEFTGLMDFNTDGNMDLLWRDVVSGDIVAWLMNGTTFTSGTLFGNVADANWQIEN